MRDIENPFAVLGLDTGASMDQIIDAWKEKVKKLHPDRYPEAPEDIVRKLNEETSRVNVAYQLLKDDLERMRAIFSTSSSSASESQSRAQQRSSSSEASSHTRRRVPRDACEVCASLNTESFTFTRQTGFIFARNVGTFTARLCKGCATAMGRTYQSRTLTTGWWGVISAPANLIYIIQNAHQLFRAGKLDDPVAPPGFRTSPLPVGKPIFYRPVSWIGIAVLGFLIFVAINSDEGSSSGKYSPPAVDLAGYEWKIGNCISGYSTVIPVPCSEPNSGRIVSVAASQYSCPAYTEKYVSSGASVYCIDTIP